MATQHPDAIEPRHIADLIRDALESYGISASKDDYDQVTITTEAGQVLSIAFEVYEHGQRLDIRAYRGVRVR